MSPKSLQAIGASAKRRKAPCQATYHYVFQDISPADLRAALGVLVQTEGGFGHVAFTGDAAFTTDAIAEAIRVRGGYYFLFMKGNQPELRSELERAFGDVPPCRDHHRGTGTKHRNAA